MLGFFCNVLVSLYKLKLFQIKRVGFFVCLLGLVYVSYTFKKDTLSKGLFI